MSETQVSNQSTTVEKGRGAKMAPKRPRRGEGNTMSRLNIGGGRRWRPSREEPTEANHSQKTSKGMG
eukprot:2582581-Prorocentrum_lima.AAC.1